MLETRCIERGSIKGEKSMKVAMLVLEIVSGPEIVELNTDDFPGMHIDTVSDIVMVSYIDSVVYRRTLALLLGLNMPNSEIKVRRRILAYATARRYAVEGENRFNDSIEAQIRWAQTHVGEASLELTQMRSLIKIEANRMDHENLG